VQEATLFSCDGQKLGTYIVLNQKNSSPVTKHDVGEDIEFPGAFLEAELIGKTPLRDEGILTLLIGLTENRVRIKSCIPLPEGSEYFQVRLRAA